MAGLGAAARAAAPRGSGRAAAAAARRSTARPLLLAACVALAAACWRWGARPCWSAQALGGRRGALAAAAAAAALAAGASDADAFPNAARTYKRDVNDPKRPGPMPGDLGVEERFGQVNPGLKECENTPNCLSTTSNEVDIGLHDLKPWKFTGKSPTDALKEVTEAINGYVPGQQGIDGGGFQIKDSGDDHVYTQFESLRRGHIDDVEFYLAPGISPDAKEGSVLVRSASRTGFYDFGVNAMRLNTISDALAKNGGWEVERITKKTHPRYWGFNCDGGNGRKAPFNVADRWPEMCN